MFKMRQHNSLLTVCCSFCWPRRQQKSCRCTRWCRRCCCLRFPGVGVDQQIVRHGFCDLASESDGHTPLKTHTGTRSIEQTQTQQFEQQPQQQRLRMMAGFDNRSSSRWRRRLRNNCAEWNSARDVIECGGGFCVFLSCAEAAVRLVRLVAQVWPDF